MPVPGRTAPRGWDHRAVTAYPLVLDLTGRRAVVVGGGRVALRRTRGLLDAGALVTVIAPTLDPELAALGADVRERAYATGDLDGAWVVHACTSSAEVNAAVAAEAAARRIFCVRADAAPAGTARTPAVTRAAGLLIAVASDTPAPAPTDPAAGPADPAAGPADLAAGAAVPVAGAAADRAAGPAADPAVGPMAGGGDPRRVAAVRDAIGLLLSTGALPLRSHRPGPGQVALVGGGPGDPGLITVRGRRLLAEADVVVVDRLAPRALLAELDPAVEVVDVGKTPHGAGPTQPDISALLVDRALAGKRVVRLKGGDPFVLGRGGEEVLACVRAGVPVQVVPGVTSAVAGPAAAGIPVTHRGVAADFAVVSGHVEPGPGAGSVIDWQALADGPATLVLLMALDRLGAAAAELVARGRPGGTPVAVVRRATLPDQQVLVATLDTVAAEVARAGLRPPAVVVVGQVVALREHLWAGSPPA
jgi:uroporphyrin-III C-methyltransferase / precorrin-2 dehydrogenase / sirohydrochlorin ferrochelatase